MPKIKFTVAYDGRTYSGWQSQPAGDTIQDNLETALKSLLKHPVRIHGSGRTDAGVHAYGQTFHIDIDPLPGIPLEKWPVAFNTRLPHSIRILNAEYAKDNFHARFSAKGKQYQYTISTSRILSPFDAGLAWHAPRALDTAIMQKTLHSIEGRHNFKAFAALRGNEPSPIPENYFHRTIFKTDMEQDGHYIRLAFTGDGFLYKMIRLLVGGIYSVGAGKISPEDFEYLLSGKHTGKSPLCAPSDGLFLMNVLY